MKLQDLPKLLPGADVRIRLRNKLCFVVISHEGRSGAAAHKKLTFATRRAVGNLRAAAPETAP